MAVLPGANDVRQAELSQAIAMRLGVQACIPLWNAGLHPDNARLGNGVALLQLTLPKIRVVNFDGPGEVKVDCLPRVLGGRISVQ